MPVFRLAHHACCEGVNDSRVEVGPGAAVELGDGFLDGARPSVGAIGSHRAEGVASPHDACDEGNVFGRKPIGIAGAVPVLVSRPDDSTHVAEDSTDL